jgi:hypothetical protein
MDAKQFALKGEFWLDFFINFILFTIEVFSLKLIIRILIWENVFVPVTFF